MLGAVFSLVRPALHTLDAEKAHDITIAALKWLPLPPPQADAPCLRVQAFRLDFPNPVGVAAGFDKNAEVPDALMRLGCGFSEIGTVTPLPQQGNPRPRLFRLSRDQAVINRFGFNNQGHAAVLKRLEARHHRSGIVGVNIGANKDAADRTADYVSGIRAFLGVADYFVVNISSPNTPGLRDLQHEAALDDLLGRVVAERDAGAEHFGRRPVLLKIAPDLGLNDLDHLVLIARKHRIDGMIVTNTTLSRPAHLQEKTVMAEMGGLSGKPLFALSTRILAETYQRVEGQFPLIGVGGIDSAQAAIDKIKAGASLIQLYSALVYHGPALVGAIKQGLSDYIVAHGMTNVGEMVGRSSKDWTSRPFPIS